MADKVKKLVDEISELKVVELSELVTALQEKLGVSAIAMPSVAAPTAQATTPGGGTGTSEAQSASGGTQTVIMTTLGENRIAVIQALRKINQNLGLKEAKDMTETLPAEVLKDAKAEDAKAASDKLKAAGATVELK